MLSVAVSYCYAECNGVLASRISKCQYFSGVKRRATTFSITTLSITTFNKTKLSILTFLIFKM
jgi:hypothetical protein